MENRRWTYSKEILEKLNIRPASLSNLIDCLVAGGWVIRKVDSKDARVKRIFLTETGKAQEEKNLHTIDVIEQKMQEGFTNEEISLMRVWLQRMEKILKDNFLTELFNTSYYLVYLNKYYCRMN